jgi:hypothetical protein
MSALQRAQSDPHVHLGERIVGQTRGRRQWGRLWPRLQLRMKMEQEMSQRANACPFYTANSTQPCQCQHGEGDQDELNTHAYCITARFEDCPVFLEIAATYPGEWLQAPRPGETSAGGGCRVCRAAAGNQSGDLPAAGKSDFASNAAMRQLRQRRWRNE